ncbi:type III toxin-antitoxin system ToxN/AbiQ family toxin [Tannockella kyphosi]|uniref:type III toxin-antitoxin system ToxN/AbiQ family toxin n=1 Tax=Tannockella kyphosi TaxID=2899121 RepID=UPI0024B383FF|nr:type III toxin-antitoxin system ToxN/AbiQ family toxin [Tannockella kyphosi]
MRFYKVNTRYLEHIHKYDNNIISTKEMIGIPVRLRGKIYFLPVCTLSKNDFDNDGNLRKTNPAILRLIDLKSNKAIGKCLFSNMLPVPYNELEIVIFDELTGNRILYEKQLNYLQKNYSRINKAANRIYSQKEKGYKHTYLNKTVNFKKIEKYALEWELEKYGKHYNRFPDSNFFLTNPQADGVGEYYLMNKHHKVARILYNHQSNDIQVVELLEKEYAPLECIVKEGILDKDVSSWFRNRGIPSWRDGLDDFLDNLGISDKDILLSKAFGLSLTDQYWLNPLSMPMEWDDINFFDNDFYTQNYKEAIFQNKIQDAYKVNLFTPNNTSDGMLKKVWICENGERYLLKGSYNEKGLEPFNEVLASMISDVLGLEYVYYCVETCYGSMVSKCACFIDGDTELISAYSVLKNAGIGMVSELDSVAVYSQYKQILLKQGIVSPGRSLVKMFLLDYIILNEDRHLGNFGIIRDVETLEWRCVAPNFDSGQSMNSQKKAYEMDFDHAKGCFFHDKNIDFENILSFIKEDIDFEITFGKLYDVVKEWKKLLKDYQAVSVLNEDIIDTLVKGLQIRIEMLENKLNEK